ncbi:MAG TPA: PD-(D/E)XK nuclease family protein [Candidatus Paceibacterota bacterium]|nr:PD-(D/E)XK nuclease family protein [Candidatus Paceibacterota bacterium]
MKKANPKKNGLQGLPLERLSKGSPWKTGRKPVIPIEHWSHSSLMAFLRNPLAWYKRYVLKVYDTPYNPASIIGRAGHVALQHFYGGIKKDGAVALGLEYLRSVPDFEINFGKAKSRLAKKKKRAQMEREYLQAVSFYLERPPKHKVLGVEVVATAEVEGLALPVKAVSDLVVESKIDPSALDIVDHKFVDSFSSDRARKTLFVMQAIFNYYTVKEKYGRPIRRFIVHECKKKKNADGSSQMRRYVIDFADCKEDFAVFHRLLNDATEEISRKRLYLPNPSDMFEGENSFDIYRLGLLEE